MAEISTKPYLIRALYEWCADNGYRPYVAVAVDERTVVPREFVRNGEIVLNISAAATNRLVIGNELLEFEARFGGVARQVSIPIENISAIFAQENGHGMAFEVPKAPAVMPASAEGPDPGVAGVPASDASKDASAPEPEAGAEAPPPARPRRKPKLSAVPADGDGASKPARRKPQIAAVPSATQADADPVGAGTAGADAASGGTVDARAAGETPDATAQAPTEIPGDDDPDPAPAPTGRPHLKRVK